MTPTVMCAKCHSRLTLPGDTLCGLCAGPLSGPFTDPAAGFAGPEAARRFALAAARKLGVAADPETLTVASIRQPLVRKLLGALSRQLVARHLHPGESAIDLPVSAWLYGTVGCGKTFAVLACLTDAVRNGLPSTKIVVGSEQQLMVPGLDSFGHSPFPGLTEGKSVVFIDDFARANYSTRLNGGAEIQRTCFDSMMGQGQSVFLTANFNPSSSVAERDILDPAVASRLAQLVPESCRLYVEGGDLRRTIPAHGRFDPHALVQR